MLENRPKWRVNSAGRVRSLMQVLLLQRSILGNAPCTFIETVSLSAMPKALRSSTPLWWVRLTADPQL